VLSGNERLAQLLEPVVTELLERVVHGGKA